MNYEKFLSEGNTNTKTAKNLRKTLILYLSPATQNSKGINLCPKASIDCTKLCLYTSGRGVFFKVQQARKRRTEFYLENRHDFLLSVAIQINKAAKKVDVLAIRLNGTSDIKLVELLTAGFEISQNVIFYDYTKILNKSGTKILKSGHKYVVAFSRSESNEQEVKQALRDKKIVAVVFNKLPDTYLNCKVYDGDSRDDLMLDIEGPAVLGLKAKGRAINSDSNFIVRI
jgi:hypothetical protein